MPDTATSIDREALQHYVDRLIGLHEDRKYTNQDIATVYIEAKAAGFVTKTLRQIVTEQKMKAGERNSHYAILDTYRRALGMLADTPLGQAAIERAAPPPPAAPPRPFAEQTIKRPASRRRKQQSLDELLDNARQHLGETAGTA